MRNRQHHALISTLLFFLSLFFLTRPDFRAPFSPGLALADDSVVSSGVSTPFSPPAPGAKNLTLAAVGDVMLTGGISEYRYREMGHPHAFDYVIEILRSADAAFANLEGPITKSSRLFPNKEFNYKMSPAAAEAVKYAGFDLLSIANNHMLDFGVPGLLDTIALLDQQGIAHAGAGRNLKAARQPAFFTVKGKKIALLAYSLTYPEEFWAGANRPGTAFGREEWVRQDTAAARLQADLVLVSFHWGAERTDTPKAYQTTLGRAAIEAGADAVLGHHPHVPQGIEIYRGKPIFYSLGNFAFGTYSQSTAVSFIAQVTFAEDRSLLEIKLVPLNVNNFEIELQPRPVTGEKATQIVQHLQKISQSFGTVIEQKDDAGYVVISPSLQN